MSEFIKRIYKAYFMQDQYCTVGLDAKYKLASVLQNTRPFTAINILGMHVSPMYSTAHHDACEFVSRYQKE